MKVLSTLSEWFEAWFAWLPVTAVAWAVSLVLAVATASGLGSALPQGPALALAIVTGGALLGLVDWFMLSPQIGGAGLWILATAVGWGASLVVAALAVIVLDPIWGRVLGGILGGLVLGGIQWIALRGEDQRVQWMLMTLLGWIAAITLSLAFSSPQWDMFWGAIFSMAVSGAVGLMLIGILAVFGRILLFPDLRKTDTGGHVRW